MIQAQRTEVAIGGADIGVALRLLEAQVNVIAVGVAAMEGDADKVKVLEIGGSMEA